VLLSMPRAVGFHSRWVPLSLVSMASLDSRIPQLLGWAVERLEREVRTRALRHLSFVWGGRMGAARPHGHTHAVRSGSTLHKTTT
jgi:hypothetical protein